MDNNDSSHYQPPLPQQGPYSEYVPHQGQQQQQPLYGDPSYGDPSYQQQQQQQQQQHHRHDSPYLEPHYYQEQPQQQEQLYQQPQQQSLTIEQAKIPYETEVNEINQHQQQQPQYPPSYNTGPTMTGFEPVPLNNINEKPIGNGNGNTNPQPSTATGAYYNTSNNNNIKSSSFPSTFSRHSKRWIISSISIIIFIIALGAGLGAGLKKHHKGGSSSSSSSGDSNSCTPPGGQMCETSGDCSDVSFDSFCMTACDGYSYCN
jgi:hypothetical protein